MKKNKTVDIAEKNNFKSILIAAGAAFIFLVAILLRSRYLNRPPIDAHPMRQTDTACVIYHYVQQEAKFLEPQTCLIRPRTNIRGLFFFEFPLYSWLAGQTQILAGTADWWPVRMMNLTLFTIAFWFLFLAVKNFFNNQTALWAVLFLALAPSSIFFFGQAIHPDILMLTCLILSFYFVTLYLKSRNILFYLATLVCLNLVIAVRPFAALTLIPITYWLYRVNLKKKAILMWGMSSLLYALWRAWQLQYPHADHTWQQWIFGGRELLLQIEYLRLLIWKNLLGEVTGKIIGLLSLLGIGWSLRVILVKGFKNITLQQAILWIWVAMIPCYWLIVPWGNIAHQYYAHVIMLPLILFAAWFMTQLNLLIRNKFIKAAIFIIIISLTAVNGWRTSRYFFIERISPQEQKLAQQIQLHIPAGKKIIYLGNSSLSISLAQRQGWTTEQPPADLRKTAKSVSAVFNQADYVVVPKFDTTFPQDEFDQLLSSLELTFADETGKIYVITNH